MLKRKPFAFQEIRRLPEEAATKEGIAATFERLVQESQRGDHLLFYFTGHGTQVKALKAADSAVEPDGQDEALVPYRYSGQRDQLILDNELDLWLERADSKGLHVTVIIDSCNSGGMVRGGGGSAGGSKAPRFQVGGRARQRRGSGQPRLVFFAAARSNESAAMNPTGSDGTSQGSRFTSLLVSRLRENPFQTPRQLYERLDDWLFPQHPQLEGQNIDGLLFADPAVALAGVTWDRARKDLWIDVGTLHQHAASGARYRLHCQDRLWPEQALARVELTEVDGFRSRARVLAVPRKVPDWSFARRCPEAQTLAMLERPALSPALTVGVAADVPATVADQVRACYAWQEPQGAPALRLVREAEPGEPGAQLCVRTAGDHRFGCIRETEPAASLCEILGRFEQERLLSNLSASKTSLIDLQLRVFRARLKPDEPREHLEGKLTDDQTEERRKPGRELVLRPRDATHADVLEFHLAHHEEGPMYFTVVEIDPAGRTHLIFPHCALGDEQLPQDPRRTPGALGGGDHLYHWVKGKDALPGRHTIKVLASTVPLQFGAALCGGARALRSTPLSPGLKTALAKRERDEPPPKQLAVAEQSYCMISCGAAATGNAAQ